MLLTILIQVFHGFPVSSGEYWESNMTVSFHMLICSSFHLIWH